MVVLGSACRAAICTSRRSHAGVEHGGDEGVAQHVWVHPRQSDASVGHEVPQPPGGGMTVHAGASPVEQQRSAGPVVGRPVNGAADGRWKWDKYDLAALASDV